MVDNNRHDLIQKLKNEFPRDESKKLVNEEDDGQTPLDIALAGFRHESLSCLANSAGENITEKPEYTAEVKGFVY